MPVIFRYDFDWGSRGVETSLWLIPSMDLIYFSIVMRSLVVETLFVVMISPLAEGLINST